MVPTAIYFKSPGTTSQLLPVQAQYLEFHRQRDGSLRMEVLTVLLNLLRAVSPRKVLRFYNSSGYFTFFL